MKYLAFRPFIVFATFLLGTGVCLFLMPGSKSPIPVSMSSLVDECVTNRCYGPRDSLLVTNIEQFEPLPEELQSIK
jgi:hypothetical protein